MFFTVRWTGTTRDPVSRLSTVPGSSYSAVTCSSFCALPSTNVIVRTSCPWAGWQPTRRPRTPTTATAAGEIFVMAHLPAVVALDEDRLGANAFGGRQPVADVERRVSTDEIREARDEEPRRRPAVVAGRGSGL